MSLRIILTKRQARLGHMQESIDDVPFGFRDMSHLLVEER